MTGKIAGVLRKTHSEWLAVMAVFVLLAHSMVAGFVDGAMAQPRLVDHLGSPICSAHAGHESDSHGHPDGHSPVPQCCLTGCSMVGGHALAASAAPFILLPRTDVAVLSPPAFEVPILAFERSPLNPRAPPGFA